MSWEWFQHDFVRLIVAALLGALVGWDREKAARGPGLRTFSLVGMASCAFIVIGHRHMAGNEQAMARLLYGLMTGIGFIGGGAIMKDRGSVHGTATAASIWCTGAIGAAVAFGEDIIAAALALFALATLRLVPPVKHKVNHETDPDSANQAENSD